MGEANSFPFLCLRFFPQNYFLRAHPAIPVLFGTGFPENLPPDGAYFPKSPLAGRPLRPYGCVGIFNHKKRKTMQKSTLEAVGLRTRTDIPAGEIFSPTFDPALYGMADEDKRRILVLKDFVQEYNREAPLDTTTPIKEAKAAAEFIYPVLRGLDHEEVWITLLGKGNLPISRHLISTGTLDASLIDTRRIIKMALDENATKVILFHNHPGGLPAPSVADITATSRLKKALGVFDMELLDHIVIADTSYYSFAEEKTTKMGGRK